MSRRAEQGEASALVAEADRVAAKDARKGGSESAKPGWDTPERRAADARHLGAKRLPQDAVEALMRSDVAQAEPAAAATRGTGRDTNAPQARKHRGREVQVSAPLER